MGLHQFDPGDDIHRKIVHPVAQDLSEIRGTDRPQGVLLVKEHLVAVGWIENYSDELVEQLVVEGVMVLPKCGMIKDPFVGNDQSAEM